jgi:hypothetical protein
VCSNGSWVTPGSSCLAGGSTIQSFGENKPIFVLRLRPLASIADAVRALRHLLKTTLRAHHIRCLSAHEERDDTSTEG